MIRYRSQKQLSLAEFEWPFQVALDEQNRWVKLSQCIPWDELAEGYYRSFSVDQGRPAKDVRLVIGAVIIKHKLCLSDEETAQQIQENPYLQYFVGLPGYQMQVPFVPSLFVEIRKRVGQEVFEVYHGAIVGAVEQMRTQQASKSKGKPSRHDDDPDDHDPPASVTEDSTAEKKPTHRGKLILDATVAEQAIRYPTDLSLLNEAREFSEQIIDLLYTETAMTRKPRTYRQQARKAYLSIVKQRRPGQKALRREIKQQLQYLRRKLGHIEILLAYWSQGVTATATQMVATPLLGDTASLCTAVGDVLQQ